MIRHHRHHQSCY